MKKTQEAIRKEITTMMVTALQENNPPWRQPWSPLANTGWPRNFASGRKYNGINPLILLFSSMSKDFSARNWGTANGWKKIGAVVSVAAEPTYIVLWTMIPRRNETSGKIDRDHHGNPIMLPLLREFPVFNVEQVRAPMRIELLTGGTIIEQMLGRKVSTPTTEYALRRIAKKYLTSRWMPKSVTRDSLAKAIHDGIEAKLDRHRTSQEERNSDPDFDPAEEFLCHTGATFVHGGQKSCYNPKTDEIHLPRKSAFDSIADYYDTAFHELLHWTQKKERVGIRKVKDESQKQDRLQYAFNELVAEIGACFLMMELGVPMADHVMQGAQRYVKGWISGMNNDSKFIFDAAAQASRSCDFLLSLCNGQELKGMKHVTATNEKC